MPSHREELADSSGMIEFDDILLWVQEQEEPETMPSRAADTSGRIEFDDILLWLQEQEEHETMPSHADTSGRIEFDDDIQDAIFQQPQQEEHMPPWLQEEPTAVQSQGATFQMPLTRIQADIADIIGERSVRNFNDILLWVGDGLEPPQQPELDITDLDDPAMVRQHGRSPIRPFTRAELDSFTTSSGWLDFDAILSSIRNDPAKYELRDDILLPEITRIPSHVLAETGDFNEPATVQPQPLRSPIRPFTRAELDSFTNSSGWLDFDAILLSIRNDPARYQPQEDETTSHEAEFAAAAFTDSSSSSDNQSKGLSEKTISRYLKTKSADETIRAHDKDFGDRKICAVCLADVCVQNDIVAILDDCRHEFHYCCLEKWLRRKNVCPLCRRIAIFL